MAGVLGHAVGVVVVAPLEAGRCSVEFVFHPVTVIPREMHKSSISRFGLFFITFLKGNHTSWRVFPDVFLFGLLVNDLDTVFVAC